MILSCFGPFHLISTPPCSLDFPKGGCQGDAKLKFPRGVVKGKFLKGSKYFVIFQEAKIFFLNFRGGEEEGILLTKISECVVNKFPKISEWIYCNRPTSASISKGLEKNCKFPRGSTKNSKFPRGSSGKPFPKGSKISGPSQTCSTKREGRPSLWL